MNHALKLILVMSAASMQPSLFAAASSPSKLCMSSNEEALYHFKRISHMTSLGSCHNRECEAWEDFAMNDSEPTLDSMSMIWQTNNRLLGCLPHFQRCIAPALYRCLVSGADLKSIPSTFAASLFVNAINLPALAELMCESIDIESTAEIIPGDQKPLLHIAIAAPKILELLLDKGADIEKKSSNNQSPLEYAVWSNRPEAVEILLKRGARITPEALQFSEKSNETIKLLLGSAL